MNVRRRLSAHITNSPRTSLRLVFTFPSSTLLYCSFRILDAASVYKDIISQSLTFRVYGYWSSTSCVFFCTTLHLDHVAGTSPKKLNVVRFESSRCENTVPGLSSVVFFLLPDYRRIHFSTIRFIFVFELAVVCLASNSASFKFLYHRVSIIWMEAGVRLRI